MKKITFNRDLEFYDFAGLASNDYRFFIINGIMDDGKTYGAKEHMLDRFLKYGERSIWIMNSRVILEEELLKFVTNNAYHNQKWNTFKLVVNQTGVSYGSLERDGKREIMCYFLAISSITKTSRDEKIKNIYYDEFNYLDARTYKQQINKFQLLLSRNMGINKIFLIGNAVSLNVPILHHLDIWQIDTSKEFFEFNVNKRKGLFHNFKREMKVIDDKYKNSISYDFMKQSSFTKHAFENEYILDDLNKIDKKYLKRHINEDIRWKYTFQIAPSIWVNLWRNYKKDEWFFNLARDEHKELTKVFIHRDFLQDGLEYADDIPTNLSYYFQKDKIWYENISIKQSLYEILKPKLELLSKII